MAGDRWLAAQHGRELVVRPAAVRRLFALVGVLLVLAAVCLGSQSANPPGPAYAQTSPTVLLPRGSVWDYSYDGTTWRAGTAPFGSSCGLFGTTAWDLGQSTIILKKEIALSGPVTGATIHLAVDDDADVFINGTQVVWSETPHCASYWSKSVFISGSQFRSGSNTIEVRAHNLVASERTIDLEIVGTVRPLPADASFGGCHPGQGCSNDPVNTFSGNYTYQHVDLAIPGRGGGVVFARAYNSLDTRDGDLGPGWTHTYNTHLVDDAPWVEVVRWNGRTDRYTQDVPDQSRYARPAGIFDTLERRTDLPLGAVWLLTQADYSKLGFDAAGKLKYVEDSNGNRTTLAYDGVTGKLLSVTDPANRGALTFKYDPTSGRLGAVKDWANPAREVRFEYGGGRLWRVWDRENRPTFFGYDGSGRLTSVSDIYGHVAVTNNYDPRQGG